MPHIKRDMNTRHGVQDCARDVATAIGDDLGGQRDAEELKPPDKASEYLLQLGVRLILTEALTQCSIPSDHDQHIQQAQNVHSPTKSSALLH